MGSIYQAERKGKRIKKYKRSRVPAFIKGPIRRGTVKKFRIMKPKKPNSANRKIAKVMLVNKNYINCYIQGMGHKMNLHATVLVRGGRVKDLPGIRYHILKGRYDFTFEENIIRKRRLSKYGYPTNDENEKRLRGW
jgi:small subunit ribosomal protein S12